MQRIRKQVDHFQQQLSGLSPGQKLLTGILVATMLATVVWWVHHATTDQAVALFEQPLPAEQGLNVKEALSMRGIACDLMGGQVYVSAEQAEAALRLLDEEHLLPSQTRELLSEPLGSGGILASAQDKEALERKHLVIKLQNTIQRYPGVRLAQVFLDTTRRQRLGGQTLPTASVSIETDGSLLPAEIAEPAATLIAGSVSELQLANVSVIVDGQPVAVHDAPLEDDALAGVERGILREIREALPDIPQLRVGVKVVGVEPSDVDMDSPVPGMPAGEVDSILAALNGIGGPDADLAGSKVEPNAARQIEDLLPEAQPASKRSQTLASCALTVPLSWIIHQWQARYGTHLFPDQTELKEYEARKLAELRQNVAMAVRGLAPDMVAIVVDNDVTLPGQTPPAAAEESSAGISALIRDYGREVAVGALAAVSLLLAGTMLKKGTPVALAAGQGFGSEAPGDLHGPDLLDAGGIEPMVGEATQALERVQALVKNDPAQAAALVQRWLNAA